MTDARKSKILIVDDRRENLVSLSAALEELGAEMVSATSGREALSILLDHEFALAIFDVQMPEMSGLELARLVRGVERLRNLPIIFVTAEKSTVENALEGYEEGAVDFLTKPLSISILKSKAKVFLKLYEQKRQLDDLVDSLRASKEAETAANRAKDHFLATLSHELRTPLNAILGWVDILKEQHDSKTLLEGLDALKRNSQIQGELISDLLDVSRIVAGKIHLDCETIDMGKLIDECIESLKPMLEQKNIVLKPEVALAGYRMNCDPKRFQQIVWNLLTNAVKFTAESGTIVVRSRVDSANNFRLDVVDSGEGISEEFLPYVFDRFRQEDTTKARRHGGLGLGLSIVKHLVELHGGEISATSEGLTKGSTFTVVAPIVESQVNVAADKKIAGEKSSKTSLWAARFANVLSGKKILVVDDAPDIRVVLRVFFERAGAKVVDAGTVKDALLEYGKDRFDLLVSDIGIPEEDGLSLIRKIRKLENGKNNMPAIALSGYVREEEKKEALDAGFSDHLGKPVQPALLVSKAAELIQRIETARKSVASVH